MELESFNGPTRGSDPWLKPLDAKVLAQLRLTMIQQSDGRTIILRPKPQPTRQRIESSSVIPVVSTTAPPTTAPPTTGPPTTTHGPTTTTTTTTHGPTTTTHMPTTPPPTTTRHANTTTTRPP